MSVLDDTKLRRRLVELVTAWRQRQHYHPGERLFDGQYEASLARQEGLRDAARELEDLLNNSTD